MAVCQHRRLGIEHEVFRSFLVVEYRSCEPSRMLDASVGPPCGEEAQHVRALFEVLPEVPLEKRVEAQWSRDIVQPDVLFVVEDEVIMISALRLEVEILDAYS